MGDRRAGRGVKISIVVPVRNGAELIGRALNSLSAQAFPDLEVIVMDAASSDGTAEIARAHPVVSQAVSEPDRGQADALNKGFARANGDILGWLCADDALAPGALRTVAELFETRPDIDVVTGGCRRIFADGSETVTAPVSDFDTRLFHMNTIEQPSTFWRRGAAEAAGALDLTLKYAFDWDYWCRMKRAGARFHGIGTVLSDYHFTGDNLTSTGGRAIMKDMFQVIRRHGPQGGRIAYLYWCLYHVFDLRGFYDTPGARDKPAWQRRVFHLTLRALHPVFGRELVNSYNWNFASRQERGMQ